MARRVDAVVLVCIIVAAALHWEPSDARDTPEEKKQPKDLNECVAECMKECDKEGNHYTHCGPKCDLECTNKDDEMKALEAYEEEAEEREEEENPKDPKGENKDPNEKEKQPENKDLKGKERRRRKRK